MKLLEVKESFINFHALQICTHTVVVDLRPLDVETTYTVQTVTADGQVYTPPETYTFNGAPGAAVGLSEWLSSIFGDATVTEQTGLSFTVIITNSTFQEITLNGEYGDIGEYDQPMESSCEAWEPEVNPCNEVTDDCLPVVSLHDLLWQTFLVDLSDVEKVAIAEPAGTTIEFYAKVCPDCNDSNHDNMNWSFVAKTFLGVNAIGPFSDGFSNGFQKVYTGWNAVLNATLVDAALNFNDIALGSCFYICLWKKVTTTEETVWSKMGCSNCLIKTDDECYTSKLRVHMKEVSMGFYNDGSGDFDTFYNSIRVPMYAHSPVPKTKKAVYVKSDGDNVKLSARMSQVYEVTTEHLHQALHFKIATALEYDRVKLTNSKGQLADALIGFDDEYKPVWNEPNYETAQAKFNIINTVFNEVNTNCRS